MLLCLFLEQVILSVTEYVAELPKTLKKLAERFFLLHVLVHDSEADIFTYVKPFLKLLKVNVYLKFHGVGICFAWIY